MPVQVPVVDVRAFLAKWKFVEVGKLTLIGQALSFSCSTTDNASTVYVVVAWDSEQRIGQPVVWYVGSAYRGWKNRHGQHNGGLKRSSAHAAAYQRHIENSGIFCVFERAAGKYCAFDAETWAQEADEAILIGLLGPKLNEQKRGRLVSSI